LVLEIWDGNEVARQAQECPLPLRHLQWVAQALEETGDIDIQRLSNPVQSPRGNAIGATFIVARLLVGEADPIGHLPLGQPKHVTSLAHAHADMPIDVLGAAPDGTSLRTRPSHRCRASREKEPRRSGHNVGFQGLLGIATSDHSAKVILATMSDTHVSGSAHPYGFRTHLRAAGASGFGFGKFLFQAFAVHAA
jgi:hypothetical protein